MKGDDDTVSAGHAANCSLVELLIAREDSQLSVSERAALEAHLDMCEHCSELVAFGEIAGGYRALAVAESERYELGDEVARGGMGIIRDALDKRLERVVAVKQLKRPDRLLEARFEREALITARLQHPAIVPIYDGGRWSTGEPFYAMKRVDGRSLHELLEAATTTTDRLTYLPNLLAVADAIAYAHEQKVVHRDLKPGNILVGPFGETVVIDWGLAKDLGARIPEEPAPAGPYRGDALLTHAGAVMGTPAYMAPEQSRGQSIDERADVYALGAILHHLLTGHAPRDDSKARTGRHLAEMPRESTIPKDLVAIAIRALADEPEDRYRDAGELAADLRRFQTGQLVAAQSYSAADMARRWLYRNRALVVGIAAVAVAVLGVGAVSLVRLTAERNRAQQSAVEAKSARDTAHASTLALLEDEGRRELLAGHRERALVFLSAAYSGGADSASLRFLLAEATSAGDTLISSVALTSGDIMGGQVQFSRDGRRLALSGPRRSAVIDADTGATVAELGAATDMDISSMLFADDGRILAAVGEKGQLQTWSVADGRNLSQQQAHQGPSRIVLSTASEQLLTAGLEDGRVALWSHSLEPVRSWLGHRGGISEVQLDPTGTRALSCGFHGSCVLWDLASGARLAELRGGGQRLVLQPVAGRQIRSAFAPDGRMVLGSEDGMVRIWDQRGQLLRSIGPFDGTVMALFDPLGEKVAIVDLRGHIVIARADDGAQLIGVAADAVGVGGALMFLEGGRQLMVPCSDNATRLFDVASGRLLALYEGFPAAAAVEQPRFALLTANNMLEVRRISTGRLQTILAGGTEGQVQRADFVRSGDLFTVAEGAGERRYGQTVRVWRKGTFDLVAERVPSEPLEMANDASRIVEMQGDTPAVRSGDGTVIRVLDEVVAPVRKLELVKDDSLLVVVDQQDAAYLFDGRTGESLAAPIRLDRRFRDMSYTDDGSRILLTTSTGFIVVDRTGRELCSGKPNGWLTNGHVIAGGRRGLFITSQPDGTDKTLGTRGAVLWNFETCTAMADLVPDPSSEPPPLHSIHAGTTRFMIQHRVWDALAGAPLAEISAPGLLSKGLLSPKETWVVTIGQQVTLWNPVDGSLVRRFDSSSIAIDGVLSPDEQLLATAHLDGGIRLWSTAQGTLLARLPAPSRFVVTGNNFQAAVATLSFSPDGSLLATGGPDQYARIWRTSYETRSADVVAKLAAAQSRWNLAGGHLEVIPTGEMAPPDPTVWFAKFKDQQPEIPDAESLGCDALSNLRSMKSEIFTIIHVANASADDVHVTWIDFEGIEQQRRDLPPGGVLNISSFESHPFVVRTIENECLQIVLPRAPTSGFIVRPAQDRP